MGIFRKIFIVLDAGIYGILEQIFQLIINLANFDLFDGNVLKEFSTRIYLILGLVMVFKLMISFIQILIEPDKMSDKEKGVGSLLRRVVISLVLIVLVPSIFSTAKRLQNYIIPIIPKVVVGVEADVDSSNIDSNATYTAGNTLDEEGNVMMSTGRLLAYYSFLPFFYYDNDQCNDGSLYGTTSDASLATIHSVGEAVGPVNNKCESSTNPDGYRYNYRLLTSTIVGAYLVYVLVTVALQIAIRTIKFGLCQVLAPIPIASYIDPKTSKQSFDKWVQTSIKVYLDLFTRLIVVYFVIFIFRLLFDQTDQLVVGEVTSRLSLIMGKYGAFQGLLLILFIIIGLLQFAKQMPKFVSDLLGVPDGFTDIGDMFKGTGFRALGTTIGRVGAPLAAMGTAAISNYHNEKALNHTVGQRLKSAFAGAASAGFRSTNAIVHGKKAGQALEIGKNGAIEARRNRLLDRQAGVRRRDRMRVALNDYMGFDSGVTYGEKQIKAADEVVGGVSGIKSSLTTLYNKYRDDISISDISDASNTYMQKIRNEINKITDSVAFQDMATDPTIDSQTKDGFINFYNKVQTGEATYGDLLAIRKFAQENAHKSEKIANFAGRLDDSATPMRNIQKAMFEASLNNGLRQADKVGVDASIDPSAMYSKLNIDSADVDDDFKNAYNQLRRKYQDNAVVLEKDPAKFEMESRNMFGGLENDVKTIRANAQDTIGDTQRTEAAARESLQRRQQNKKQNGGN